MRKQTKLVAVLSAAALLALGASMTSFAAGWEKDEAGVWHFYDEDDELVTGEWKKDGGKWFYLDDDGEHWYYFGSDGKMYSKAKQKKVNGKYYYFNNHGQMLYEWINGVKSPMGSNANLDSDAKATTSEIRYMNVVEEGWRADDDKYITELKDGDDSVVRAKIKISGKNFCFNEYGQMQTGLQPINTDGKLAFYYFDGDGYMKTGKIANVKEENDTFTYYFETKNGKSGQGVTGEKSGYLYWNGKRIEADDDYKVYQLGEDAYYLVNNKGKLQKSSTKDFEIENLDGKKCNFVIDKNTYKIQSVTDTDDTAIALTELNAELPKIELFDSVVTSDEKDLKPIVNPAE